MTVCVGGCGSEIAEETEKDVTFGFKWDSHGKINILPNPHPLLMLLGTAE